MRLLSLVLPVFNEQSCIPHFFSQLETLHLSLLNLGVEIELVFVDDGSTDESVSKILAQRSSFNLAVVQLSRNFGKEAALLAGLEHASGDAVVPYDIDMQDPLHVVEEMVRHWIDGARRVVAVRRDRTAESLVKRKTSALYHRLLQSMSDSPIEPEVGDFQLLDREVLEKFLNIRDKVRYTKGLFSWMGYRPAVVTYDRVSRSEGSSKFTLFSLLTLALSGLLSLSVKPIKLIAVCGIIVAMFSLSLAVYFLSLRIFSGVDVPGYASLAVMISFFSGVQMIFLGVIGMYVGTILNESKDRPIYVVEKVHEKINSA